MSCSPEWIGFLIRRSPIPAGLTHAGYCGESQLHGQIPWFPSLPSPQASLKILRPLFPVLLRPKPSALQHPCIRYPLKGEECFLFQKPGHHKPVVIHNRKFNPVPVLRLFYLMRRLPLIKYFMDPDHRTIAAAGSFTVVSTISNSSRISAVTFSSANRVISAELSSTF